MSLVRELKRRNVFRVAIAYAVVAWLLIEITSTVFPLLQLPDWTATFVAVLLIVGFPVAVVFAWAYELTPEGIKREHEVDRSKSITHLTGRKLDFAIIGLLILALGYLAFDKFVLDHTYDVKLAEAIAPAELAQDSVVMEKSIAVLPFDDLSPDKDQEYFVLGLSEEILDSLTQIPELTVTAKTSSFSFRGTTKKVPEIAGELGVAHILEGSVRKAGNALRITAQLIKAADGSHLWSRTYDKEFDVEEIFSVQEEIARAVANELKITLGVGDVIRQLGGTDNQEAYELYLTGIGRWRAAQVRTVQEMKEADDRALRSLNAAIELDPQFALAWSAKARIETSYEPDQALAAALRAMELQPSLSNGYAALGNLKRFAGEFIEAEMAYEKALELSSDAASRYDYGNLLQDVAYFKKAHELLSEGRQADPLNPLVGLTYLENLGLLGNIEQAEKENERMTTLYGRDRPGSWLITNVRLGSGRPVTRDQIVSANFDRLNDVAKEYLETPEQGLSAVRQFYGETEDLSLPDLSSIAFWAAYFGDHDLAMDSIEKVVSFDKENIKIYWYPLFKDVRQLPRFKKLIREIGLVDFWNKFGWPEICYETGDGDFACD